MIEVMFAIRKDGFKDHPVIPDGLDLVEEEDQFTHMLPLDDEYNSEDVLSKSTKRRRDFDQLRSTRILTCSPNVCFCVFVDVFKLDPDFVENEEKYKTIKRGENEQKRHALSVQSVDGLINPPSPPDRYPGRGQQRLRGGGRRQR